MSECGLTDITEHASSKASPPARRHLIAGDGGSESGFGPVLLRRRKVFPGLRGNGLAAMTSPYASSRLRGDCAAPTEPVRIRPAPIVTDR